MLERIHLPAGTSSHAHTLAVLEGRAVTQLDPFFSEQNQAECSGCVCGGRLSLLLRLNGVCLGVLGGILLNAPLRVMMSVHEYIVTFYEWRVSIFTQAFANGLRIIRLEVQVHWLLPPRRPANLSVLNCTC